MLWRSSRCRPVLSLQAQEPTCLHKCLHDLVKSVMQLCRALISLALSSMIQKTSESASRGPTHLPYDAEVHPIHVLLHMLRHHRYW